MSLVTWTSECTQSLLAHVAAGAACSKIAVALNEKFGTSYTAAAVSKKMVRLGKARGGHGEVWSDEMKAALVELYSASIALSYRDITAALNERFSADYSRCAVIGQGKRLGLKGKGPVSSAPRAPAAPRKSRVRTEQASPRVNRPARIPLEAIALRCVEIIPRHLSLLELEKNDCRYPYGDDVITFCGHPKMDGSSYCAPHFHLSRGPGTSGERAATKVSTKLLAVA